MNVHISDFSKWCALSFSNATANPLYYARDLYLNGEKVIDLEISDTITCIGAYAFSRMTNLVNIAISDSVTNIGYLAFSDCTSLKRVTIGRGVKGIDGQAFKNCNSLTNLLFEGNAPVVGNNVFSGVSADCCGFVRGGSSGWNIAIPGKWKGILLDYLHHMVKYDVNGGEQGIEEVNVVDGSDIGTLPIPTRARALFLGWFTEPDGGSAVDASLKVTEPMTLYARWLTIEEAMEVDGKMQISSSEALSWMPVLDENAKIGNATARSGAIGDKSDTWLSATVSGAGKLSFWCKVSCEHDDDNTFTWDRLMVYTNGVEITDWRMDGETGWTLRELTFDEGDNTVKWVYFKDRILADGDDCAWVDGLSWLPSGISDTSVMVGGKMVTIPGSWIERYPKILESVGGNAVLALATKAANGNRTVAECYLLGINPEDPVDDFKIVSFEMKDGVPVFRFSHTLDGSGNELEPRIRKLGKVDLTDANWSVVPAGGDPNLRFFTVELQMP